MRNWNEVRSRPLEDPDAPRGPRSGDRRGPPRQLEDAYREARQSGATDTEALAARRAACHRLGRAQPAAAQSRRERVAPVDRWAREADDRAIETRQRLTLGAELRQDLLYGLRALARHKSLAAVAIISLALGIGANTALFSVMHALLFRPLPVRAPAELVAIPTRPPTAS